MTDDFQDEVRKLVEVEIHNRIPALMALMRSLMLDRFSAGCVYDIAVEDPAIRRIANGACWVVARVLWDKGMSNLVAQLFTELWDSLGERQRTSGRHIYRAMAAGLAGQSQHLMGNSGHSFRWALLTHADDVLDGHGEGGGLGRDMLLGVFGMNERAFDRFHQIASECRVLAAGKWDMPFGFAEEVVQRYIQDAGNSAFSEQISGLAGATAFPLSRPYFSVLLREVREKRDRGQETKQGRKLEEAAFYLFSLLPGCIPMRTVHDMFEAFTFDVVVTNVFYAPNLLSDLFGRYIVAECKNWQDPINAARVGYFLHTARTVHARLAVIFSKGGVAPLNEEERNARSLMKRAYNEDGTIAIVFTDADLTELEQGTVSFLWLLLQKADEQRFGRRGT